MAHVKICEECNEEFTAVKKTQRFCSVSCSTTSRAEKRAMEKGESATVYNLECDYCGKHFSFHRKKAYCSTNCRLMANNRKKEPEEPKNKKSTKKKRTASLSEVLARAKAEGITYGECVAKYGYE